ncbi:MAG: 3-phosphoserine/phosphohydroxythreonine transaminase [Candidatus Sericytochromatia bacterium]|nr:3-phosphoserine/phosphohydroxythreonine transaminase [Candidatus Sericytochromatia bacterium]
MPVTQAPVWNFYAGPATLPRPVLQQAQDELLDFAGTGMSVMEISHRAKPYMAVQADAEARLRELLGVPDTHRVLFLQGGATLQFAMVPMNLRRPGQTAAYVHTGEWAGKAYKEAKLLGDATLLGSSEDTRFDRIPGVGAVSENLAYLHVTSNETVQGIQWQAWPEASTVPLVADMSSDILSRAIDVSRFGLIYAGAQKNLGPSGVTVVIVREDLVARAPAGLPTMMAYDTHVKADSMYNTPPTLAVYLLREVLAWMGKEGGLEAIAARNARKAARLYGVIDRHPDLYEGHARPEARSAMNVTFRLPDPAMEQAFLKLAESHGLVGLAGHRSVGGCRASIYNAMPEAGVEALALFMEGFARQGA